MKRMCNWKVFKPSMVAMDVLSQWERLKAEQDKEDLKDCTFAPAVNACAVPHTPLHRRLSELQRQRRCAHMHLATPYK